MTISNTTTEDTYLGTGSQTAFSIPFAYLSGEVTVIVVTLIESDGTRVLQTLPTHYDFDDPTDPTEVQMVTPPAADETLEVKRTSPLTQLTDLQPSTPYPPETIEKMVDRNLMLLQEIDNRIDDLESPAAVAVPDAIIPDWATTTAYVLNQVVYYTDSKLYRCLVAHTSGSFETDYGLGKWELVETAGIKGETGDVGGNGPTGATGPAGPAGTPGTNGSDGIFAAIASQAEAEAGTDNTKGMSPLRTAQAITAQVSLHPDVTTLQSEMTQAQSDITNLQSRVAILEVTNYEKGKFAGSDTLVNNQATPVELLGSIGTGNGNGLWRDGDGSEFAYINIYMTRITDTETRFSSFRLLMHFVGGVWYIGRDMTSVLSDTFEADGVTFSVATDVENVGQVSYVTDNMSGANYSGKIKYIGQEIHIGV